VKALGLLFFLAAAPEPLVEVRARIPDVVVDLRYATPDNFMKKPVYPPDARCLLLERSARMLARAAAMLRAKGFRLKVYDCYRPHPVQFELWKVMPVPGYVADPKQGSHHNRGGAVDLTLVTLDGGAVEMPSAYDFFGEAAHHGFKGATPEATRHRETLREAMEAAGFKKNPLEWWHYELPDAAKYPLRSEPFTSDVGAGWAPDAGQGMRPAR
jgi:D-alanyl-D-alanine dipeptidase